MKLNVYQVRYVYYKQWRHSILIVQFIMYSETEQNNTNFNKNMILQHINIY